MVWAEDPVDQEMCAFEELSLPCEEGLVGGPARMGGRLGALPPVLAPQAGTGAVEGGGGEEWMSLGSVQVRKAGAGDRVEQGQVRMNLGSGHGD